MWNGQGWKEKLSARWWAYGVVFSLWAGSCSTYSDRKGWLCRVLWARQRPASHTFLWHWESEHFICTDHPCVRCDRGPSYTMSGYETHTMSGYENKGARIKAYMEQLGKQWNLISLVVILATRWVIIGYFTNFVSTFYRIGAKVPCRSKNQGFLWQLWNKEKVNTRP